jgi:hypothetical protein
MPDALQARILADFAAMRPQPVEPVSRASVDPVQASVATLPLWRRPAPAWFAAAASVLLAVAFWARGPEVVEVEVERLVEVAPTTPAPDVRRAGLLQDEDNLLRPEWQLTEAYAALDVRGDVVWSPARQEGYMRFAGLPSNDPSAAQYQLWIFDATRDDSTPVDGGVFDVPAGAEEVVVPIRANLPVREAVLFAVTREPSGGVMVSSREELLLVASVN